MENDAEQTGVPYDLSKWKLEIREFLKLKRSIYVFMCPFPMSRLFDFGSYQYPDIVGKKIEFIGPEFLRPFWNSVGNLAVYHTKWQDKILGQPFLHVNAMPHQVIGSWLKYEAGNIFFLPNLSLSDQDEHDKEHVLISAIITLEEALSQQTSSVKLPPWTMHMTWPRLNELNERLIGCQKRLERATENLASAVRTFDSENILKVLISAQGDILEDRVIETLQKIGFKTWRGERGRADVLLKWKGKSAVAEIKGKQKSAAESDARQLEHWIIDYRPSKPIPKGFLIINAYCDTPLNDDYWQ